MPVTRSKSLKHRDAAGALPTIPQQTKRGKSKKESNTTSAGKAAHNQKIGEIQTVAQQKDPSTDVQWHLHMVSIPTEIVYTLNHSTMRHFIVNECMDIKEEPDTSVDNTLSKSPEQSIERDPLQSDSCTVNVKSSDLTLSAVDQPVEQTLSANEIRDSSLKDLGNATVEPCGSESIIVKGELEAEYVSPMKVECPSPTRTIIKSELEHECPSPIIIETELEDACPSPARTIIKSELEEECESQQTIDVPVPCIATDSHSSPSIRVQHPSASSYSQQSPNKMRRLYNEYDQSFRDETPKRKRICESDNESDCERDFERQRPKRRRLSSNCFPQNGRRCVRPRWSDIRFSVSSERSIVENDMSDDSESDYGWEDPPPPKPDLKSVERKPTEDVNSHISGKVQMFMGKLNSEYDLDVIEESKNELFKAIDESIAEETAKKVMELNQKIQKKKDDYVLNLFGTDDFESWDNDPALSNVDMTEKLEPLKSPAVADVSLFDKMTMKHCEKGT